MQCCDFQIANLTTSWTLSHDGIDLTWQEKESLDAELILQALGHEFLV